MNLTNPQRVRKLAGDLLRHPAHVPLYAKHNLLQRQSPIELGLPWFSYDAIAFLRKFLRREMSVFEFGSGGSTIFFAQQCASVTSVEDNPEWAQLVRGRLSALGLSNSTIIEAPFDFDQPEGFEESHYLQQVRLGTFDVIVVDGADNDYTIRPRCFAVAEEQVQPGGIIVVDDSWRYEQLRSANRAKRVTVFESVGPARFGVTSTDVYFY